MLFICPELSGERRTTHALGDIGNLVPARIDVKIGKPLKRPITVSYPSLDLSAHIYGLDFDEISIFVQELEGAIGGECTVLSRQQCEEAYSDSDYAGANLDRISTTGGCQFLGRRLISWQYKKQTILATSTIEAEYVAARVLVGIMEVTIQAKEIKDLKAHIKKLKKKARPMITHHKAWMQSGRKTAKSKPTAHKDQAFDDPDDFGPIDYMETEDAHNEKGVSTEDQVNTVKPDEATPTVFGDNETIAEFLVSMSQNKARQKGVEIKDVEDSNRPRPTSTRSLLTLKPLPKIDPKDKGKKVLEEEAESDAESEGVNEAERKFAQLANDEEIARKVQEEWETEEKNKKLAEEEATKVALIRDYDDIQARIEADSILAARLQEEEREKFTIEERAKLLHDTIAAQRKFLAQQRAEDFNKMYP
ncbi:hypothetical protein Tco_0593927 [Tanacetum coccineum]